jgi:hypothetical protein
MALAAILAPTGVAIASGLQPPSGASFAAWAVAVTVALVLSAAVLGPMFARDTSEHLETVLYVALLINLLYLAVDVLAHGLATRLSPLTAFFQTGIRFYGMGNEYVAVFIPGLLWLAAMTLERAEVAKPSRSTLVALGLALAGAAAFIGWKNAGANLGGMLTMLVGGSVFWAAAARGWGVWPAWLAALASSAAIAAAIVWLDAIGDRPTHIGAFAQSAASGHSGAAALIRNKAEIALRLATSPGFIAAALGGLILWRQRALRQPLRAVTARRPWCGVAARAGIVSAAVATVLNDSGPSMLALMLTGVALPLACLTRNSHASTLAEAGPFTQSTIRP